MTTTCAERQPGETGSTALADFRARCEERAGRPLVDPTQLHAFSVESAAVFWSTFLEWSGLPWSGSAEPVLVGDGIETARFFPNVSLNYAEALLRPLSGVDDDAPALTSVHADRATERLSRRELRAQVSRTAAALATCGIGVGSRVVAIAPNNAQVTAAVLATVALGATVATATPDVGTAALLGRFEQVDPVLLLLDRTGVVGDPAEATAALLAGLPALRRVLILDDLPLPDQPAVPVTRLAEQIAATVDAPAPEWPRLPFDHPLFVMFSSGTTGPPKAMVHGAGGTLLEHVKEHRLHGDLTAGETLYFHTTTAWMMWNWQLSALAVGAHIVLYDGPIHGPQTLWDLVAEHGVAVFGTSPAYLQLCQDTGYRPVDALDLAPLRSVLSTGAVLHDWQFDWVADAVGSQPLQSISGGTDIIGCFVLGYPDTPVRTGRCQSRSLGLDVAAVDEDGREVVGAVGELVCRKPFPSRPVGFLRDPDGARFHKAYFADHPGMWTHGDLIDFDTDGTARMHGRSDGILNVDGVRIGPAEIYTTLHRVPGIAAAMAVEQRDPDRPGLSRMVLLVVLAEDAVFDGELDRTIRRTLRRENSAAHVPALVVAVPDLPTTHNGKRSERAARDAVNGDRVANEAALRNPSSLAAIGTAVRGRAPVAAVAVEPAVQDADLRAVGRIWREILGVSGAEPEDDFLDMGGTSRGMMDLLRRVKLELGADVLIRDFVTRPTLERLAGNVAAARDAVAQEVPLLRTGTGRPVHFIADHCGQLNLFHDLVQRLDIERPVFGLNPPVHDASGARRTIAEVAEDALALLRAAQPDGPYSLIGYSFGGLVAFEMASRLEAAGSVVGYVGLIDVAPPIASLTATEVTQRKWAGRLQTLTSIEGAKDSVARHLGGLRGTAAAPTADELEFGRACVTFDAHRIGRFGGPVTYFLAEERLPVVGNQLGVWSRAAPHLMVTEVPGGHWTMLQEQYRDPLAARISATLRAV